jgi:CdiI immunity protein
MPAKKTSQKPTPQISSEQFPALREFLRGYFHEDLADEYGSPEAAARQFWQDADEEQRQDVAQEWSTLLARTKNLSLAQVNESLQKLGSAWTFDSLAEVQSIAQIFRKVH